MRTLNFILLPFLTFALAIGPIHVGAEIPKNETPVETATDQYGNQIEGLEVVPVPEADAKKMGVYNAALKITFKEMEQNAHKIFRKAAKKSYKINSGQKTVTADEKKTTEQMLYFGLESMQNLENFSPENMWNKRFIQHIQFNQQYEAIRTQNSPRNISIRFPAEVIMFYGVIAANACAFSTGHYLMTGARTNLTCLDTFTGSFKDPITTLGFASFVGGSAATQLAGNRVLKLLDSKALGFRDELIRKQYENLATNQVTNSALTRFESKAISTISPKLGEVPKLSRWLGPSGMAMGMLVSRIFEESIRDENMQMCAKGVYLNATKKNASEIEANLPREYMLYCQSAWDSWMKSSRWQHYGVDMVGLVTASFMAHGLISGATYGLKAAGSGIAQGIVKGLQFRFNFGAKGLKSMAPDYAALMAPRFQFLNTALSPLAPSSIVNLSGFMAVDHGIVSKVTSAVKIEDQADRLRIRKLKEIDREVARLIKEYSQSRNPQDKGFDREFRDYSADMAMLRQTKTGAISEAVSNWMNKTNEFLGVYQGANQFYRDFFFTDATTNDSVETTLAVNPFDYRDYLRKVKSWINRGSFEGNPLGMIIDSVDQPLSSGTKQFPISVILKATGYTGNEIANFPFLSKLETATNTAEELMNGMIEGMTKSTAAGKTKKEQSEVVGLLNSLGTGPTNWQELVAKILPKLNDEQKAILIVYVELRAANYKLLPNQVLTPEEMRLLKLEENIRVKSIGKNEDIVEKFSEPTDRDVIKLITRANKRSVKELELRMKHAESGVQKLADAAKKFPGSELIVAAKEDLGDPSQAAPKGVKFLTELMTDTSRFPPDLFMHYPKSLKYVHSLRPVDFLMISMACGPSSYLLKPVSKDASFSELLNSPLITSPVGSALVFNPPGISFIESKVLKNEICETQQSAQELYEREFNVGGKKYKGLVDLVRNNIRNEFRKFEPRASGVESDTLKFDTWWNTHVKSIVSGLLEKMQAEYYNIVIKDIIPQLVNEKVFEHLNSDTEFNVSIMRELSEAAYQLVLTEARGSKSWDQEDKFKIFKNDLYNRTNAIKTQMHSIEEFLVVAANAEKIFPPGTEKADLSYLANSNAIYLEKRRKVLSDVAELGKILGIQIEIGAADKNGHGEEIKINGGLKFARGSEGERVTETALRNVVNNINELHRYSDMIYLLTKSIN